MQKIDIILVIILLNTGCSVLNNAEKHKVSNIQQISEFEISNSIKKFNITERNFYINKAEIKIEGFEKKEKIFGSIKFISPEKYLFSFKALTGIELARILLSSDTLLIIDRLNKKFYFGSSQYLRQFLGITPDFLPLIFGDIIGENVSDSILYRCNEEEINIERYKKGIKVNYTFSCKKEKSKLAVIINSLDQREIQITYKKYLEEKDFIIPREINITDLQRKIFINIRIIRFETPWEGKIELLPGNGYEKLPLK